VPKRLAVVVDKIAEFHSLKVIFYIRWRYVCWKEETRKAMWERIKGKALVGGEVGIKKTMNLRNLNPRPLNRGSCAFSILWRSRETENDENGLAATL